MLKLTWTYPQSLSLRLSYTFSSEGVLKRLQCRKSNINSYILSSSHTSVLSTS